MNSQNMYEYTKYVNIISYDCFIFLGTLTYVVSSIIPRKKVRKKSKK